MIVCTDPSCVHAAEVDFPYNTLDLKIEGSTPEQLSDAINAVPSAHTTIFSNEGFVRFGIGSGGSVKQYACEKFDSILTSTRQSGQYSGVDIRTNPNGVLFVNGAFSAGDANRIIQVLEQQDTFLVVLASPGGVVEEAFSVADAIRERGLETYVPYGAECNSACFFPFMAGERRLADGDLSVHRPAAADPDATAPVNDVIRLMSDYVTKAKELSVPDNILKYILESEVLVTLSQSEKLQITTADMRHVNLCSKMALADAM